MTEYNELLKAIVLLEEMNIYLNRSDKEKIHAGSIFHQEMRAILDDYYAKRSKS